MRIFGHYVLSSRVRLFVAEQSAAGVLFLAAAASAGATGHRALLVAAACALSLQGAAYLADLYEPADPFPEVRWLFAAGAGLASVTLVWRLSGSNPSAVLPAAGGALTLLVLLRQVTLTRPRRAIVVGTGAMARPVAALRESGQDCLILGYVADRQPDDGQKAPLPILLDRGSLDSIAGRMKADLIVVATPAALPEEELARARSAGVEVVSAAGFTARYGRRLPSELMDRAELVFGEGFAATPLTDAVQRVLDLATASLLLLLSAPLLVLAMIAVRLDSPGPVFYRQDRVGKGGVPFFITKLRTMRRDAESAGPVWAAEHDQRVTRIGQILRKSRIDELPQLVSVLRGDMSVVGPRPERPFFVEQLARRIPLYGLRELVKPGVTGWAQIRCPYGSSIEDARRKLEYDLYYIRHRSLFLNLTILFHTVRTVVTGRGAR